MEKSVAAGCEEYQKDARVAFRATKGNTRNSLESKEEFTEALRNAGRSLKSEKIDKYWKDHDAMTFMQFCQVLKQEPPVSQTQMMDAFKRIDANGDGFISRDELMDLFTKKSGRKVGEEMAQKLIDFMDTDGDGKINYNEFCARFHQSTQLLQAVGSSHASNGSAGSSASSTSEQKPRLKERRTSNSENSSTLTSVVIECDFSPDDQAKAKVIKPRDLSKWHKSTIRAGIFLDEERKLTAAPVAFELDKPTTLFAVVHPLKLKNMPKVPSFGPVLLLLTKTGRSASSENFFAEGRENDQSILRCDVGGGSYKLVPLTSFNALNTTNHGKEVKLSKAGGDDAVLTAEAKAALTDIFSMFDSDGDQHMTHEDFYLYNYRTSGEELGEEEWNFLEESGRLRNSKLPLDQLLELNRLEASEQGDDDVWVTLQNCGYNKSLELVEALPIEITIHSKDCPIKLQKRTFETLDTFDKPLLGAIKEKGSSKAMRSMNVLHWNLPWLVAIAAVNQSDRDVQLQLQPSEMKKTRFTRHLKTISVAKKGEQMVGFVFPDDIEEECSAKLKISLP